MASPPATAPSLAGISNQHGDRYPEAAAPYIDSLPPRVLRAQRNAQMTGYAVINDKEYGKITATKNDTWTQEVIERFKRLGLVRFAGLANHVEMKTAMAMIASRARTGQVTINHAPCGHEPGQPPGCHDLISAFLPKGCSLTVLGTDAQGQPFHYVYQGRAVQ